MPSRKSSTSWSILPTTLPVNIFKKLWSFFRSSTLCIANKLKKEKAASQAKTEEFYIQANISIGDTDSIFPSLLPASITTYVLITSRHFENPYLPSLQSVQPHHILVSTDHSPSQTPLCVPPYSILKQTLCYFLNVQANSTPASLSLFLTTWHSGMSFKALPHISSTVKPLSDFRKRVFLLRVPTGLCSCFHTFYHPLQFMFAFSVFFLLNCPTWNSHVFNPCWEGDIWVTFECPKSGTVLGIW